MMKYFKHLLITGVLLTSLFTCKKAEGMQAFERTKKYITYTNKYITYVAKGIMTYRNIKARTQQEGILGFTKATIESTVNEVVERVAGLEPKNETHEAIVNAAKMLLNNKPILTPINNIAIITIEQATANTASKNKLKPILKSLFNDTDFQDNAKILVQAALQRVANHLSPPPTIISNLLNIVLEAVLNKLI